MPEPSRPVDRPSAEQPSPSPPPRFPHLGISRTDPPAICVVSRMDGVGLVCQVHSQPAPCTANGEPATAAPLQVGNDMPLETALRDWQLFTKGQRGLVLHNGPLLVDPQGDGAEHDPTPDCWCAPAFLPGREISNPPPP